MLSKSTKPFGSSDSRMSALVSLIIEKKRVVAIVAASVVSIILLASLFFNGNDSEKKTTTTTTTTTTLPDKKAPACDFLTEEVLAAGGIIPDVDPKISDQKRRCTYTDIGGLVNYITLYVDSLDKCDVLIEGLGEGKALDEVARGAKYYDDTDPTIIVPQDSRCFFVQGSKTLVDKDALVSIANAVAELFKAVDTSTTTTTSTTVVLPETQLTLPGQNTASSSTTATTTKVTD